MTVAEIPSPPSARRIVLLTLSALAVALTILFGAVLPAEYNRDPLGLGGATGIAALWSPEEKIVAAQDSQAAAAPAARSYATPFRGDVVEIPMTATGDPRHRDEVEYKVRLKAGDSYVYGWEVAGVDDPELFYTEFHGHTVETGKEITVAYYRKATGTADGGMLTAPFDGVHGWYFQNQSNKPVTVRLRIAGFYALIPDGQPGNEFGFHARQVQ